MIQRDTINMPSQYSRLAPSKIKRHASYAASFDESKGIIFTGKGKQSEIDWQSPSMQFAPFELGWVINSIRTGYLPIESPQTKTVWQVAEGISLTDVYRSIIDKDLNMDDLLDKACFPSDSLEVNAIQKLLIDRFLWWVDKHGSVATKPEYMTMTNFVTQAKKFEWFYLYQGWDKPSGRIKRLGYDKTRILQKLDEMIEEGTDKFAPRQQFGIREPLNMQGALYLIVEERYQNIQKGLWDLARTKKGEVPSMVKCANKWSACLSLIPSIAGAKNPQKCCSDYCRKRRAYYTSEKAGLQERLDAYDRQAGIYSRLRNE